MIFFPRSLSKWQWAAADYKVKTQPPTPTQRVTISAASSLTIEDVIKWKPLPVPGEFLTQRPVTRSFDVFFDLRLNKRLSKQSWGWWFETLSHPLWRHRNAKCLILYVLHFRRHLTIPPLEINMVSDHELRTMWLTFQRPLKIRRIRPISRPSSLAAIWECRYWAVVSAKWDLSWRLVKSRRCTCLVTRFCYQQDRHTFVTWPRLTWIFKKSHFGSTLV